jgi:hypothetical protein
MYTNLLNQRFYFVLSTRMSHPLSQPLCLNEDAEFMGAFERFQKQLDEAAAPVAERIVLWLDGQDAVQWRMIITELKLRYQENFAEEGSSVYSTLLTLLLKRGHSLGMPLRPYYQYVPAKEIVLLKQIFPPNGFVFETLPSVVKLDVGQIKVSDS